MRAVPDTWLFEPWKMPPNLQMSSGLSAEPIQPVVDLADATRTAKQRLHARRQQADVKAGKKAVIEKHASRKTLKNRPVSSASKAVTTQQLGFDF
jgi:deoxyribodipyrimidine photo-lyase